MTAFYERDGVSIYLGDCREILPTLARESHDLIVTDPPYGVGWQSNARSESFAPIAGDDGSLDVPAALSLAGLALRRSRHAYVFGRFDLAFPLVAKADLVWDKELMGSGDLTSAWGPSHEPIMFAYRVADRAAANMRGGAVPARLRHGTVIRCKRPNATGVRRHPTEKPVALLRQLVESSSHVGESVLDPFLGSGSTLVAAVLEGRVGLGIELDEGYAETAAKRVDAALDAIKHIERAAA